MADSKDYKKINWGFVLILVISFVVLPSVAGTVLYQVIKTRDIASQRNSLLNYYQKEESRMPEVMRTYSMVKDSFSTIDTIIPDRDNLVPFFEQIDSMGRDLDMVVNVSLSEGVLDDQGIVVSANTDTTKNLVNYLDIEGVEILELGLSMNGSLDKVLRFISMLENMSYYTQITSIKNANIEGEGLSTILTVNLFVKPGRG